MPGIKTEPNYVMLLFSVGFRKILGVHWLDFSPVLFSSYTIFMV